MKKPIFPRILGLIALYIVIFTGLVLLQFTKRSSFTHRNGNLVVSGFYREDVEQPILSDTEYLISGDVTVFFQGVEFILAPDRGFIMKDDQGTAVEFTLEKMSVSGENIHIMLSDGSVIAFSPQFIGGNQELRIIGNFNDDIEFAEFPITIPRSSEIDENKTLVVSSNGIMYSFSKNSVDAERKVLTLTRNIPQAYYAVIPDRNGFNPADYILAEAASIREYDDAVQKWREQSYLIWSKQVQSNPSEELVAAYLAESVKRGNYRSAAAAVPQSFLNSVQRSFVSSVFLGRLDLGLRSISAHEREYLAGVSRLINEKSEDLFNEPHVFYQLFARNMTGFINDGAAIAGAADPASLKMRSVPGIFEGWRDWISMRIAEENPFERLLEQAFFVISQHIIHFEADNAVFVHEENKIDILYNVALGKALIEYGDASGNYDRAAIGRSIILSVLNLVDQAGMVPLSANIAEDGSLQVSADEKTDSFHLYVMIFHYDEYYPRVVPIKSSPGVWAWTAASSVTSVMENNVLDISAGFTVGETHYIIIRGVKPFTKIQLYNMDYRTDPQFEHYDSSGWSYSPSEQTLLIKMKHKTSIEHVRIFY